MKRMLKIFGLTLALGIVFYSCNSDDDDNGSTQEPPIGMEDDDPMGTDDDTPPVEELESGWLIGYRTSTPQGLIWYMEANEELPDETDQSNAVEIGLNADIYTHESGIYTWNGNAATITKWDVDRTNLEFSVTGLLSLASSGITGNAPNLFFSETQAFISFLAEGVVVEWNPSAMEIIEVHNVDPLPDLGTTFGFYTEQVLYATSDGKIMMPIVFSTPVNCCDTSELPNPAGAMLAVFDPATSSVEYLRDNRMIANHSTFMTDSTDGAFYMVPNFSNSYWEPYYDLTGQPIPYGVLRINADGSFDPDFFVDLTDFVDITFLRSQFFVYDQKFVLSYLDAADYEHPESYADRFGSFGQTAELIIVDLVTGDVMDFAGFNGSGFDAAIFLDTVEGVNYFSGFNAATEQGGLLIQNGTDALTTVTVHNGNNDFQAIAKLW
ncbi:MAG: hypothetical protein AAGC45_11520 [Bacteroidota bacterium]